MPETPQVPLPDLPSRPRIASLVPSLTELLVALGIGPWLVARTGFCIHPEAALRDVPKIGGTKDVNLAKLRRLAPTHVLVNVDENQRETADALREFVPQVIVTHPRAPQDVIALIDDVAARFGTLPGVLQAAKGMREDLQRELDRPRHGSAVDVLYLIWKDPWMTVARDTYIASLLATVGWNTLPALNGGDAGAARYPTLRGDEPWLTDVSEVLLSSEPYRFGADHIADAQRLCPQATVRLVDGELLSWYGPRTAAGLRYLRTLAGT